MTKDPHLFQTGRGSKVQACSPNVSLEMIADCKGNLYECIRPLLCTGRLLGLVPISCVFNRNPKTWIFRFKSFVSVTSLFVMICIFFYIAIAAAAFMNTRASNASEIVMNLSEIVFAGIGFYVCLFMYKNSSKLIKLLNKWQETKTSFQKEDVHLFRNINIISSIIFLTGMIENVASHWKFFKAAFVDKIEKSTSEIFMQELFKVFTSLITPNATIAVVLFVADKMLAFAWNFGDVFITVMALAMSNRFKFLFEDFKEKIDSGTISPADPSNWILLCHDHDVLCDLLMQFNELFSPLIFACLFANVYFVSLELYFFLLPNDNDIIKNIYDACAFSQFLLRTFMGITFSAKVNQYAHQVVQLLSQCSPSALTKQVERTELKLRTSTIGFKGLNCFTITNSFLLSVFNVVFTVEIVLLQSSAIQSNYTLNQNM